MSLFNKLKKIFSKPIEEKKTEILNFSQLEARIDQEENEIQEQEKEIKKEIMNKIVTFDSEIKPNIKILENINLENRKEQEKIKLVVMENLKLYINYLSKLPSDLKRVENLNLQEYIEKIDQIIENFNKLSKMTFEKATILIGKELENTKETLENNFRNLRIIIKENNQLFKNKSLINQIRISLNTLNSTKKNYEEFEENIKKHEKRKIEIDKNITEIHERISKIDSSQEHKESKNIKEKREIELKELEREIHQLKTDLDLKSIAKYFHGDEKKSRLIKEYSENFNKALENDSSLEIEELARQSKGLSIDLKSVREKLADLSQIILTETDNKLKELEESKEHLNIENLSLEKETINEQEKKEKLKIREKELIETLKNQAKELNLEIN